MPDDPQLLQQIARGDHAAFGMLLQRHASYLYGVAYALTGRRAADAEDLVQETLIAAIEAGGTFRGDAAVRTWLVQILVNRSAMSRRSTMRREKHAAAKQAQDASSSSAEPTQGPADARLDLSVMLETLSPEHRAVIVLRELQGLSYDEIASTLGIPRGTVESRLHRAREELKKRFQGY